MAYVLLGISLMRPNVLSTHERNRCNKKAHEKHTSDTRIEIEVKRIISKIEDRGGECIAMKTKRVPRRPLVEKIPMAEDVSTLCYHSWHDLLHLMNCTRL